MKLSILLLTMFIFCVYSCMQKEQKNITKSISTDSNSSFWERKTYYSNGKVHTTTLIDKDSIPIRIQSYRPNGVIEAEFLFGKKRDTLGYGLAIYYDSLLHEKIENVEIVGISISNIAKKYTLFYRENEIEKIDKDDYLRWRKIIGVPNKSYYFDW